MWSGGENPYHDDGSLIVVLATDAPLLPHQLKRIAKRAEAAAELRIPEGTVKSRCFYALKNLRNAFRELGVVTGDL